MSWFTWLEQGRDIKVSRQVLAALARTLRLEPAERQHLYRLAGELPDAGDDARDERDTDARLRDLLAILEPNPAFVMDIHWDLISWNRAEAALFTDFAALPPEQRNMIWLIFAWPPARALFVDWERQARPVLAQFRIAADEHPTDPRFAEILADVRNARDDFDSWWSRHDVADYQTVIKRFNHPSAGLLTLHQVKLIPANDPSLQFVVRYPADSETNEVLPRLMQPARVPSRTPR